MGSTMLLGPKTGILVLLTLLFARGATAQTSPPHGFDVVFRNPAASIQRALASRFAQSVFSEAAVMRALGEDNRGVAATRAKLIGVANELRTMLPARAHVVCGPQTFAAYAAFLGIGVVKDLAGKARDSAASPATRAALRDELLEAIHRLEGFDGEARLEFESGDAARRFFDRLDELIVAVGEHGASSAAEAVEGGEQIEFMFDLGAFWGFDDAEWLAGLGLGTGTDDPALLAITAASSDLRFRFRIRRMGSVVEVEVRAVGAPGSPMPIRGLAPVARDGPILELTTADHDTADYLDRLVRLANRVIPSAERESYAGEWFAWAALCSTAASERTKPQRFELAVTLEGNELKLRWTSTFSTELAAATTGELDELVPPRTSFVVLDATTDLATGLVKFIDSARGRLVSRLWTAELKGDRASEETLRDVSVGLETTLRHLEPELLRMREVWRPGSGLVVSNDGYLDASGGPLRSAVESPLPAVAFFGRAASPERGLSACRTILTAFARLVGADESVIEADSVSIDGAVGVLTVPGDVLAARAGGVKLGADTALHAFALTDGTVVVSSSIAMSKNIARTHRASLSRSEESRAEAGDTWVLRTSGRDLAGLACWGCAAAAQWLACLGGEHTRTAIPLDAWAEAFTRLETVLGSVDLRSTREGKALRGEGTIRFGPPGPSVSEALAEVRSTHTQPWPEDVVLIASGTRGRFRELEGPFRFAMARDGRFNTRVDHALGTANAWDGHTATTWFAETGTTEARGNHAEFSLLWASALSGFWAEEGTPVESELVHASADEFEFALRTGAGLSAARIRFDRRRRVVTEFQGFGHRPHLVAADYVTRLDDYRLVGGRLLPHRISDGVAVGGEETANRRNANGYDIEEWVAAPLAGESFRLDAKGRVRHLLDPHAGRGLDLERGAGAEELVVAARIGVDREVRLALRPTMWVTVIDHRLLDELHAAELHGGYRERVLDSLTIGPLRIEQPTVMPAGMPDSDAPGAVHGILGMDAFFGVVLELDRAGSRLTFHARDEALDPALKWCALGYDSGQTLYEVRLPSDRSELVELEFGKAVAIRLSAAGRARLSPDERSILSRDRRLGSVDASALTLEDVPVRESFWWWPWMRESRHGGQLTLDVLRPPRLFIDAGRMRYAASF